MRYYSVTQVLSPFVDFSKIPEGVLSAATARGSDVHRICAMIARGLWVKDIPEECRGYVESYRHWLDRAVDEVLAIEEELRDENYGYVAHPDLIVRMKDIRSVTVIDLKTPVALRRTWQAQLSAYLHVAARRYEAMRAGSLRLDPKGGIAKMEWYQDSKRDFAVFLSALNTFRYFDQE